jgi:hypothetical protein
VMGYLKIPNPKRVWKIGYCKFDIYLSFGACNLVFFCFITLRPMADHEIIATLCKLNVQKSSLKEEERHHESTI